MRIFVVDRSPMLSKRIAGFISEVQGLDVVGYEHSLADAAKSIRAMKPDVVMMDVSLLGKSGLDLVASVSHEDDSSFLMMLSGDFDDLKTGADVLLYSAANVDKAMEILQQLLQRTTTNFGVINS